MALDDAVALLADGRTATMLTDAAAIAARRARAGPGRRGRRRHAARPARRGAPGATVVGAVGSEAKRALATSLGADEPSLRRRRRTGPFDVVFDGVGGAVAREAFAQLAPGGRMLSYGLACGAWADISAEEAAARGVTLVQPDRRRTRCAATPSARWPRA